MKSRMFVGFLKAIMGKVGLLAGAVNLMLYQGSVDDWGNSSFITSVAQDFAMLPMTSWHRVDNHHKITSTSTSHKLTPLFVNSTSHRNATTMSSPLLASEFQHHDGVAIVTKIHGPHQWGLLLQSLCLLHFVYNQRVLYDIVVFTAEPISEDLVESLESLIAPAKVKVVMDNHGLQKMIQSLSPKRYRLFLNRCLNYTKATQNQQYYHEIIDINEEAFIQNLTWFSDCGDGRLAYNWQAEFRGWHIWSHPAVSKYKWMLWMDTDGFCIKPWDRDPVAIAIENNMTILFDNFRGGGSRKIATDVANAFGISLCQLRMTTDGHLETKLGTVPDAVDNILCNHSRIVSIHGFFHITNLDFYRSEQVLKVIEAFFGDCFLCRFPDDQMSVTLPAAIFTPRKSWDMRRKGIKLDIFHNFRIDGRDDEKSIGFKQLWKLKRLRQSMKEARGVCPVTEKA